LVGAAAESGAVIGPLWGGLITQFLTWQWVFWINIPISILVLFFLHLTVPKTVARHGKIDYFGSLLLISGFCILTLGFSEIGGSTVLMLGHLVLGMVLFSIYIFYGSKSSNPIIPKSLFRKAGFAAANIVHLLYGAALMVTMITIPLMANTVLQGSSLDGGLILGRLTIAIPVGAIIGSMICRKYDVRIVAIPGLILCVASLLAMSTWNEEIADPWMTIHLIVGGFGFGSLITPITLSAINAASDSMKGSAAGMISSSRFAGMTLGVAGLSAWGAGKFTDLLLGIKLPIPMKGENSQQIAERTSQFQSDLTIAGVNLFSDFYMLGAIICLISIIPCVFMVARRANS
jgi:MFS family permease